MAPSTLVFVHGYSVTNLNTYGELPERLLTEALLQNRSIIIHNVYLGQYISFNDEVRLADLAIAFQNALKDQIPSGTEFICISHSTGAPIVRTWLHLFYTKQNTNSCPLTHLIMLAPANHGSGLAQLGKSRLSRIKSWFDNIEPGEKILNWLELGSEEAWQLNKAWIISEASELISKHIFPFVLSGQDIDRKLYDHLNSYTGELGSDGVVRLASANLNSTYLKLEQSTLQLIQEETASNLVITSYKEAPLTAMRILYKRSHSGNNMGILKSVANDVGEFESKETIDTIFECLSVNSIETYSQTSERFKLKSTEVQQKSFIEVEEKVLKKNYYIHDRFSMVIFKLQDNEGYPVTDFDLILTTGIDNNPDNFPKGFFVDRQRNKVNQATLSYYFNYDLMIGSKEVMHNGEMIRKESAGIDSIGIIIRARPDKGFVKFMPCEIKATKELLEKIIKPNRTTLVEITLFRCLSNQVFRFNKSDGNGFSKKEFKDLDPGNDFII